MTVKDLLLLIALMGLLAQGMALSSAETVARALMNDLERCDALNSKLMDAQ